MASINLGKGRLEAFSDGVIAIIVTIMVLELKVPRTASAGALLPLAPVFISYLLSFLIVAIMWINHHTMIHGVREVNPKVLWLNMNLLFWMSLIPFVTGWIGEHYLDPLPVSLYGIDVGLSAASFFLLRTEMARQDRHDALRLSNHRRLQLKSIFTISLYAVGASLAGVSVYASLIIYVINPLLYFLPDREILEAEVVIK